MECEPCLCKFCAMYKDLYDDILSSAPFWLTISPTFDARTPSVANKEWWDELTDLLKCSSKILGVAEFNNERLHYHIMYSCTDRIKSYKLVNHWRLSNMVRIYKGGPKNGLHYLFKDIEDTQELLNINDIIITADALYAYKHNTIKKRCHKLALADDVSITQWFKKGVSDDDSSQQSDE